jgi:hypothetical protein
VTADSRQRTEKEVREFRVEGFKDGNLPTALFTWWVAWKRKGAFNTEFTESAEKRGEEGRDESRPYKRGALVDD